MRPVNSLALACVVVALVSALPASAATITVTSVADAGGTCPGATCTLRQAIATATAGSTIDFSLPPNATINLTSGELLIDKNLAIYGPGAKSLKVQRSTAAGTPEFRVFNIERPSVPISVTLSGLTISNGKREASATGSGGGLRISVATVNINDCTVSDNMTGAHGGGISTAAGSTVNIANSTLSDNRADVLGGGIENYGTLTISNSTISGNRAQVGAGIINQVGTTTLINTTITANVASDQGGGVAQGGGTVNARNTIIAGNLGTSAPDFKFSLVSQGYNIIGNTSGSTISGSSTGNQLNVNPLLDTLKDNGGPTFTHALLSGSPAIDAGHSSAYNTDQRGFVRPVDSPTLPNSSGGDGSDIGAYEVQAAILPGCSSTPKIVTNENDAGAGSLRGTIASVCAGTTITFGPNVAAISLTSGELALNKSLTISGPGANVLSVRRSAAAGSFRIFNVSPASVIASIGGITIANGKSTSTGGAINNGGTLVLTDTAVTDSTSSNNGGGINNTRTLTIVNSTISGNKSTGGFGGGILNSATLNVTNSTISGNEVTEPSFGIGSGGGIHTIGGGTTTISNSTVTGNIAQYRAGGLGNASATVVSKNTIVALNTAPDSGPDVLGALTSQGFNLVGNVTGATVTSAQFSDLLGVTPGELNLGPMQDNGGPTLTHALLPGSVAINKGHSSGSGTDQRGFARPLGVAAVSGGDGADIGAWEFSERGIDVDGNLVYDPLTDGFLIIRYLFGLTGSSLTSGAIGTAPTRSLPGEVLQYLDSIRPVLDVDGNAQVDALTDGLLLVRYLAGSRGTSLTTGATGPGTMRTTGQIQTYIQSLMP